MEVELDPGTGYTYIRELKDRLAQLLSTQQTIEDIKISMNNYKFGQSDIIKLAIQEGHKQINKAKPPKHSAYSPGAFADTIHQITSFAVAKVSNLVKNEYEPDYEVKKFKQAFIDFILNEVLDLSKTFVKQQKNYIITRNDIKTAMHVEPVLVDLFLSDDKITLLTSNNPIFAQLSFSSNHNPELTKLTYEQKVKNMRDSETKFQRDLLFINKVFKERLNEVCPTLKSEIDSLFCNIEELFELSSQIMTILEEAIESASQSDTDIPYVGSQILELALAEEFHAYYTYASGISETKDKSNVWNKTYTSIIDNINMSNMKLDPELTNIEGSRMLKSMEAAFRQMLPNHILNVVIQFFHYYNDIDDLIKLSFSHNLDLDDRTALRETKSILLKTKLGVESKLILYGKYGPKQNDMTDNLEAKKKESIRRDLEDSIRKDLERLLEAKLKQERDRPLQYMPPPDIYRFSEPDNHKNIQFEMVDSDQIPVIKCATLLKLVERLTFHKYQPNIVDTFLTTYRSFIEDPEELLKLLVERYNIPDPPVYIVCPNSVNEDDLPGCDRITYRKYLRKFRQEYSKPVKMRVINVVKSWIKNHYYDFERHPTLLTNLNKFLDEILTKDKLLRPLVVSIRNLISQKSTSFMLSQPPPAIEKPSNLDILTVDPLDFGRQLTLLEFDMFRKIKPSELIDVRDISFKSNKKDDKFETSPNVQMMTKHFTKISYWIRKRIVETPDLVERSNIYNRAVEIIGVLRELNNFTGLLIVGSAIESASIMRLTATKSNLTSSNKKILEDYRQLNDNHMKKMHMELKNCNPPCIPYVGFYQTKLVQAREGNKTFLEGVEEPTSPTSPGPSKIINFTKQRIRAGLVAEISNYQNQPYCLIEDEKIQQYIKSLENKMDKFEKSLLEREKPVSGDVCQLLDDYLFRKSEEIEPKARKR